MKKPVIFTLIAIALLYAVREFEYAGIRKNKNGEFAKLRQAFEEENNFDILFIGSSRAECQYYTPYIDSTTGLHSFNIGMTGAIMPFIRATLEAYLVHSKPPKYVILNLDLHSFGDNHDTVYNFPRYFAYLDNEKLYEGLKARDKRFRYFKYFPVYSMPYYTNKYFNSSLRGWLGKPGKYDKDAEQGFVPEIKDGRLGDLDTLTMVSYNIPAPPYLWEEMDEIVKICHANGSKLILVVAPVFYRCEENVLNYQQSLADCHQYAAKNQLDFIDLAHDSIRFNKELYSDPAHLDKKGALIFTRHFSAELIQYLKP